MIIVELNGGLGNQLFQYASAKSLALHHNSVLKLDVNFFTSANKMHDLVYFNIDDQVADLNEIEISIKRSVFRKLSEKVKPNHKRKIYREPYYHFDPHFFNASGDVYLKGLRQSPKYFLSFEQEIRRRLQVKQEYVARLYPVKERLTGVNSVSIHIRRGDYETQVAQDVLGLLPLKYFRDSIQKFSSLLGNPVFYIFSDDIDWVKKNLMIDHPHEFTSRFLSKNSIEDFYLMSHCRHHIIANSTFSWWAAWLNTNPDKIVIAPAKWFNKAPFDTRDLIPPGWLRVANNEI